MERGRRTPNILFVDFEASAGFINPYRLQPARSIESGSFRVLPPLSPKIPAPSSAPRAYKMTPPRSVSRRDKAAFVIIPDPVQRPSGLGSPVAGNRLGRVSPFRGKGFRPKEPITPRPTREPSPASETSDGDEENSNRQRNKSRLPVASPGHAAGRKSASNTLKKHGKSSIPQPVKNEDSNTGKKTDEEIKLGEDSVKSKPPLPLNHENAISAKDQLSVGTPPSKRKLRHRNSVERLIVLNRATARFPKSAPQEETPEEDALRTPSAKRRHVNNLIAPKKLFRHRDSVEKIIALNRAASPFGKILSPEEKEANRRNKSPNTLAAPVRKFEKKHSIEKLIAVNRMRRLTAAKAPNSPASTRKGSSTSRASRASLASITRATAAARGSAVSHRGSAASNRGSPTSNRSSLAAITRATAAAKGSTLSRGSAASKRGSPTSNRASLASITRATAAARGSALSRGSATSNRGSATSRTSAKSGRTSAAKTRSPRSSVRRSLASSIALSTMKSLHSSGENDDGGTKGKKSRAGSGRSKKGSASPKGKKKAGVSMAKISKAQMLLTEMSKESEKSMDKGDEGIEVSKQNTNEPEDKNDNMPSKSIITEKKTEKHVSDPVIMQQAQEKPKKPKVYPEPSATLVRTTAAPAIELVKPDIIPEIIASILPPPEPVDVEVVPPVQEVKKDENKNTVGQSKESIQSTNSIDKVKALASLKASLKKKSLAKVSQSMRGKVQGEADVEVLSANNLMKPNESSNRPGWAQRSPQVTPLTNATQATKKKTEESKPNKCCKCCSKIPCCNRFTDGLSQLCSKLNCCKKSETSTTAKVPLWRKILCCCKKKDDVKSKKPQSKEGCFKKCLKTICCCCCCSGKKKDSKEKAKESKCCAKCKGCCRGCCNGCSRGIGKCWRAIFCLNRGCCQKIRDKCCCTKASCCLPGGCCGRALMPGEERHDPKRQSSKSQRVTKKRDQDGPKLDPSLLDHVSVMRAAIPILPIPLAYFCLFFNTFLPGTGTLCSGLFCLCFGKSRFSLKDTSAGRLGSFCVNLLVSVSQAFTIIFCLVGWGWSIWWGVIMVRVARKYKRLQQMENTVPTTSQPQIDPEQGNVRH